VADVLRAELARRSWARESVAIGAATDPYQPAEGRYRLTRACLEALAASRTPFGIVTRSPMVVRDADVLAEAAVRAKVTVTLSVPTLDEAVWRTTEPGTPPPLQRLRAVERLREAGIEAGVALAPVLPGLSDSPEQLEAVVSAAAAAGAVHLWASPVHLKPGTREHYLRSLERDWPGLAPLYDGLYGTRAYLPASEAAPLRALVRDLRARHRTSRRHRPLLRPPAAVEQLALAVDEAHRRRA